jgi:hypothetical protein
MMGHLGLRAIQEAKFQPMVRSKEQSVHRTDTLRKKNPPNERGTSTWRILTGNEGKGSRLGGIGTSFNHTKERVEMLTKTESTIALLC